MSEGRALDAETALLIECHRRRRQLGDKLLGELNRAIEVRMPPPPKPRTIPAPGYREVGMARFRATTRVASANESGLWTESAKSLSPISTLC